MGIGQVFVFITAAITFAFILIFGYSAVSDFLEKGETVEFYQFKNTIESSVKALPFSDTIILQVPDGLAEARLAKKKNDNIVISPHLIHYLFMLGVKNPILICLKKINFPKWLMRRSNQ